MDTRTFYGARKVTHVSTLAEVNETIENAKHVVNVVVLAPEAGDSGSQETLVARRVMLKVLLRVWKKFLSQLKNLK